MLAANNFGNLQTDNAPCVFFRYILDNIYYRVYKKWVPSRPGRGPTPPELRLHLSHLSIVGLTKCCWSFSEAGG